MRSRRGWFGEVCHLMVGQLRGVLRERRTGDGAGVMSGGPRYGRGRLSYADEQFWRGDHSLPRELPGGVQDPFLCDLQHQPGAGNALDSRSAAVMPKGSCRCRTRRAAPELGKPLPPTRAATTTNSWPEPVRSLHKRCTLFVSARRSSTIDEVINNRMTSAR